MGIGKVYNVRRNAWHTLSLSQDAPVLIVENRDLADQPQCPVLIALALRFYPTCCSSRWHIAQNLHSVFGHDDVILDRAPPRPGK